MKPFRFFGGRLLYSTFSPRYFFCVALPPRICRSLKLRSNISRTRSNKSSSTYFKRSDTSLCTVDLLMEKCAEHARTVQPVDTIYSAHFLALSSIYSHKIPTLRFWFTDYTYVEKLWYMTDFLVFNRLFCRASGLPSSPCLLRSGKFSSPSHSASK